MQNHGVANRNNENWDDIGQQGINPVVNVNDEPVVFKQYTLNAAVWPEILQAKHPTVDSGDEDCHENDNKCHAASA